jgi:transposase
MFSASQTGARASATLYSLIETAKHNGLEPYRYLRYVLTNIAEGREDIAGLLPFKLKSEDIDC